jgi:catechol 2,3-dioxygenase-like lactoylglutathione lyase family enzyme
VGAQTPTPYRVVDLNYVSLYVADFDAATAFYSRVFGPPEHVEDGAETQGWRMGATWLTVFPAKVSGVPDGNPAIPSSLCRCPRQGRSMRCTTS